MAIQCGPVQLHSLDVCFNKCYVIRSAQDLLQTERSKEKPGKRGNKRHSGLSTLCSFDLHISKIGIVRSHDQYSPDMALHYGVGRKFSSSIHYMSYLRETWSITTKKVRLPTFQERSRSLVHQTRPANKQQLALG